MSKHNTGTAPNATAPTKPPPTLRARLNLLLSGYQGHPQQTPAQTNIDSTNGYIQNTGYAPDYDYSNKLDITLNSTDDFSKTEYRRATADMEMKYTTDEEE